MVFDGNRTVKQMNNKPVCLVVSALVLIGILASSAEVHSFDAYETIYIRADGTVEPLEAGIATSDKTAYHFTDNIEGSIILEKDNIVIDGSGFTIRGTGSGTGIDMTYRNNVTIRNLEINMFYNGIFLLSSMNNSVSGTKVTNNRYGISLYKSSGNKIFKNRIAENSETGVFICHSSENLILENNITSNAHCGIGLEESSNNNTVSGNHIRDNSWGIYTIVFSNRNSICKNEILENNQGGISLHDASNWLIHDNIISSNANHGLLFNRTCHYNTVCGNNVANNRLGIGVDFSYDNMIFHNNLMGNMQQACIAWSGCANTWNSSYEGNYWSDYNGTDSDHDGIGDIEYLIDESNLDFHPLMGIFHSFNTSVGNPVPIVSNSTIEDLTYFASNSTIKIHASNMTAYQKHGFCRVCIPYSLINQTFRVTVNGHEPLYSNYDLRQNGTHRWIYFAYEHSTLEIVIVPEYSSLITLALLIPATSLATATCRRPRRVRKGIMAQD